MACACRGRGGEENNITPIAPFLVFLSHFVPTIELILCPCILQLISTFVPILASSSCILHPSPFILLQVSSRPHRAQQPVLIHGGGAHPRGCLAFPSLPFPSVSRTTAPPTSPRPQVRPASALDVSRVHQRAPGFPCRPDLTRRERAPLKNSVPAGPPILSGAGVGAGVGVGQDRGSSECYLSME